MDLDDWRGLYKQLLSAYGKLPNAEQANVYFAALSAYPVTAVREAVTLEIRESRGWPSAAALAGRASNYLSGHAAPSTACDVCHGERFTSHRCDEASVDINTPCVSCGQKHPKTRNGFWYARFCYQCHPAARRSGEAA